MLSIRLSRIGKKNHPCYRLIVVDKRRDPWGNYLEDLGYYNPMTTPSTINFNAERVKYWVSVGAQPSPTVHNLLIDQKILDAVKIIVGKAKTRKAEPEAKPAQPSQTPASPSARPDPVGSPAPAPVKK
mgnify:CR=1 FL=1